jgi:ribosomal protein L16/L10AE
MADPFGQGKGQPTWTAPRIKDGHARLRIEMLDDHRCAIGLRERVIQFHHPSQPYGAGQ